MIRLSLQPSPSSDASAFNKMRAFSSRCAELLPLPSIASSRRRSSALSRTTYRFTEGDLAAIISSIAPITMDARIAKSFRVSLKRATTHGLLTEKAPSRDTQAVLTRGNTIRSTVDSRNGLELGAANAFLPTAFRRPALNRASPFDRL